MQFIQPHVAGPAHHYSMEAIRNVCLNLLIETGFKFDRGFSCEHVTKILIYFASFSGSRDVLITSSLSFFLVGSARHVPPPRPSVSLLSETSVSLGWTPWSLNGGLNVRFVKVQYREISSERQRTSWNTLEDDLAPSSSSYTVTGLKPG